MRMALCMCVALGGIQYSFCNQFTHMYFCIYDYTSKESCYCISVHLKRVLLVWFESQLILNDFDSAAIAGVDQLCEPSVLRLGERERERGRGSGREGEGERERGRERGREREKVIDNHSCILQECFSGWTIYHSMFTIGHTHTHTHTPSPVLAWFCSSLL